MKYINRLFSAFLILAALFLSLQASETEEIAYCKKLYENSLYELCVMQSEFFKENYDSSEYIDTADLLIIKSKFNLESYEEVILLSEYFIISHPESSVGGEVRLFHAEALSKSGQLEEAEEMLDEYILWQNDPVLLGRSLVVLSGIVLADGRLDKGETLLLELSELNHPDYNPYACYNLANLYFLQGKYQLSKEKVNYFLANYSGSSLYFDANLLFVKLLYNQKKHEEALDRINEISKVQIADPDKSSELKNILAEIYFDKGEYELALDVFQGIINDNPLYEKNNLIQENIAWCYYKSGQMGKAAGEFQKVYSLYKEKSNSVKCLFKSADILFRQKDYDAAVKALRLIIEKREEPLFKEYFDDAVYLLSLAYYEMQAWDNAVKYAEMGFLSDKYSEKLTFMTAEIYFSQKKYEKASKDYLFFIGKFPESKLAQKAYYRLGLCLYNRKLYPQAAKKFEEFLNKYPFGDEAARASFYIGESLYKQGLFIESIKYYLAVLAFDSAADIHAAASYSLGWAYFELEDYVNAKHYFTQVISLSPESSYANDAKERIGDCLINLKEYEKAVSAYGSLDMDKAVYKKGLSYFLGKSYANAAYSFTKVLNDFPESSIREEAAFHLIQCKKLLGLWQDKAQLEQDFLSEYPQSQHRKDMEFGLANSYYNLTDYQKAESAYLSFISNHTGDSLTVDASVALLYVYELSGREAAVDSIYSLYSSTFSKTGLSHEFTLKASRFYVDAGRNEKAKELLSLLLEEAAPRKYQYRARFALGEIYEKESDFAESSEQYRKAFLLNNAPLSLYKLAINLRQAGEYDESNSFSQLFLEKYIDSEFIPNMLLCTGDNYIDLGETENAGMYYNQLRRDHAGTYFDKMGQIGLARIEIISGSSSEAKKILRPFLADSNSRISALAYYYTASALMKEEDYNKALLDLYRIVYIYPSQTEVVLDSKLLIMKIYIIHDEKEKLDEIYRDILDSGREKYIELAKTIYEGDG